MSPLDKIQLFENQSIRTAWDEEREEWYFSIVDVVAVLINQDDQRKAAKYWSVLKVRLKEEGSEVTTNCSQLKMTAADGKKRLTDVATTEQLFRIIQSVPSPKAEPFKLWLAQVGRERIEENIDPEQTIDRALATYLRKGYSKEWSGMTTREYKNLKGLKKENLRDNMSTLELVLNMLAEATTTEISKQRKPETFDENVEVAREGGDVAGIARCAVEERTGIPVVTSKNALELNRITLPAIEESQYS